MIITAEAGNHSVSGATTDMQVFCVWEFQGHHVFLKIKIVVVCERNNYLLNYFSHIISHRVNVTVLAHVVVCEMLQVYYCVLFVSIFCRSFACRLSWRKQRRN